MVSKGFPNVTTSGRQYNIGEKPSVILYTYINLHDTNQNHNPFWVFSYLPHHLRLGWSQYMHECVGASQGYRGVRVRVRVRIRVSWGGWWVLGVLPRPVGWLVGSWRWGKYMVICPTGVGIPL